jgi:hypothetical protein
MIHGGTNGRGDFKWQRANGKIQIVLHLPFAVSNSSTGTLTPET